MKSKNLSKGIKMISYPTEITGRKPGSARWSAALLMLTMGLVFALTGCQSQDSFFTSPVKQHEAKTNAPMAASEQDLLKAINAPARPAGGDTNEAITLREGNVLKISFPGSPSMNTVQTIRQDGKITLPLVGEVKAAGETPAGLDKMLTDLYAPQLTTKEVNVEVQSSSFPIYVTGAVLRPGKLTSDQSITALEAVMEAGGFDYAKANMKAVVLIRKTGNGTKKYTLNLKAVMDGESSEQFYLRPEDILFVPEKFTWF
jgi:polysaccharide biosynthesis/export protein